MTFKSAKIALAIICLNSSIQFTATNNDGYIEDRTQYKVNTAAMLNGWSWGVNRSYACIPGDSCEHPPGNENDYDTWGTTYGGYDPGPFDPLDPFNGSAGNDDPDPDPTDPGAGENGGGDDSKRQCEAEVDQLVTECKNTYTFYTAAAGSLCVRLTGSWSKSFCGGIASSLISSARDWCDSQGAAMKQRECN